MTPTQAHNHQTRKRTPWLVPLVCACLAFTTRNTAALTPGDIAIIGFNADDPEDWSFVALTNITGNTDITFTESSTDSLTYRTPAAGLPQGTVVVITPQVANVSAPTASIGSISAYSLDWGWSSSGDSLTASAAGSAIYFLERFPTAVLIPAGLSYQNYTAVSQPDNIDNGRYLGARTANRLQLLQQIADTNLWEYTEGALNEALDLSSAPFTNAFNVLPPPQPSSWVGIPLDGYMYRNPGPGFNSAPTTLASGTPPRILTIQTDDNNAMTATNCYAGPRDSIGNNGNSTFALYFPSNSFPNGASITTTKLRAQYQGNTGTSGTLMIHASNNRSVTRWYEGGTNLGALVSAEIPWTSTEGQTLFDVTSLLNTETAINNAEFVVVNRASSTGRLYFDYFALEVDFALSGTPTINATGGASAITPSSATLNGYLETGLPNPRILVYWGRTDGGTTPTAWEHVRDLGTLPPGPFITTLTGLTANQNYFYRPFATNSTGTDWADNSVPFATTPPALAFTAAAASGIENITPVTITVSLATTSAVPTSVSYAITGGTATPGADFTLTPQTLTFAPGQATRSFTMEIIDDAIEEDAETIVLTLTNAVNAVIGNPAQFTYTISDNDASAGLQFVNPPYTAPESVGTLLIPVAVAAASGKTVSIAYATSDNTATAGSDYLAASGTLTWEPGETKTNLIAIQILNDTLPEVAETFHVTLSEPVNTRILGANPVVVTIPENDFTPPLATNLPPSAVTSNSATLRAELLSQGGLATRVWFYWGPTDGEATPAAWNQSTNLGLRSPGNIEQAVSALATNRTYYYRLLASNSLGRVWATPSVPFVTGPPTLEFLTPASADSEKESPLLIPIVMRTPAPYSQTVTLTYAVTGGSATLNTDYELLGNGTLIIPPGMTATNIPIRIVNDLRNEDDEDILITLTSIINGRIGANHTHRYTIIDNDPLPSLSFGGSPYSATEGGPAMVVTVRLDRVSGRGVGVQFSTQDGTARDGTHYRGTNRFLYWPAGTTSQTVTLPLLADAASLEDMFFFMRLSQPSNAVIATPRTDVRLREKNAVPPRVTNGNGVQRLRGGLARLTGAVTDGIPYPNATLYWGTANGGTNPAGWQHAIPLGPQSGAFSAEITGLTPNTTYHYRAFATNSAAGAWAPNTTTFTTPATRNLYINDNQTTDDMYTAATGDDANNGLTPATPKASLNGLLAAHTLGPGDTVFIDTGLYASDLATWILDTHRGTSNAPVVFRGSTRGQGSELTLTAQAINFDDVLWVQVPGEAHLTFEHLRFSRGSSGLRITGGGLDYSRGIEVTACTFLENYYFNGGLTLENCAGPRLTGNQAFDNRLAGIELNYCTDVNAVSNTCERNGFYGIWAIDTDRLRLEGNTCSQQYEGGGDGIALTGFPLDPILLNNRLRLNTGAGIRLLNATRPLLSGNEASQNGEDGFNLAGTDPTITGNTAHNNGRHGFHVPASGSTVVANNLATASGGFNIHLPAVKSVMHVENNTLHGGNGIRIDDPFDVTLKHNVIWADGTNRTAIQLTQPPSSGGVLRSDYQLLRATAGATVGHWGATAATNLPAWQSLTGGDSHSLADDPLFIDTGDGQDFHLQSDQGSYRSHLGIAYWYPDPTNSPAIDAGDLTAPPALEPTPNGMRRNLGAYGGTTQASKSLVSPFLFTVTLSAQPPEAGQVFIDPFVPLYPSGTLVTVWAVITNNAYAWERWDGDLQSTTLSNSITVTAPMTIIGRFTLKSSNNYGIPNAWFEQYGLEASDAGAEEDTDNDGHLNWMEYTAGTHPTNPASVLTLLSLRHRLPRSEVTFLTVTNRFYRLEHNTNLNQPVWTLLPSAPSTTAPLTTNPLPGTSSVTTLFFTPPTPTTTLRIGVDPPTP